MNGRSSSIRRAAVVGFTLLMGASFLGCHAGPRLFTQRDRAHPEERSAKKELADSGKFINRKRLRPESDYFTDEQVEGERISRGDAKKPEKIRALSLSRSAANQDRSVANRGDSSAKRGGPELADAAGTRTNKSTTTSAKPTRSTERPRSALRELDDRVATKSRSTDRDGNSNKTPSTTGGQTAQPTVRELLDDFPLDEQASTARVAQAPAAKSASVAKTSAIDEDPFKDAVVSRAAENRSTAQIAALKHDAFDDLDDVQEEETEEFAEMQQTAARGSATAARSDSTQVARRVIEASVQAKQKCLPEDLDKTNSSPVAATSSKALQIDRLERTPKKTARDLTSDELEQSAFESSDRNGTLRGPSLSLSTPANAGSGVLSERRQQLKNTIDTWRREMDRTDVTGEVVFAPPPNTAARASLPVDRSQVRDNDFNSQDPSNRVPAFGTEDFEPPRKSQGAVLNGELILDTSSLPSRFQRTPGRLSDDQSASSRRSTFGDSQGRQHSNTGANIDIVPRSSQTYSHRPSGQIALQSFAGSNDEPSSSRLSNAHLKQFDQRARQLNGSAPLPAHGSNVAGAGISETFSSSGETGPKLMPIDDDVQSVQPPSTITSSAPKIDWGLEKSDALSVRGWKGMLLVIGCFSSAIFVGLGLRRRQQLVPVRVSHPSSHSRAQSDDPTTYPHG